MHINVPFACENIKSLLKKISEEKTCQEKNGIDGEKKRAAEAKDEGILFWIYLRNG